MEDSNQSSKTTQMDNIAESLISEKHRSKGHRRRRWWGSTCVIFCCIKKMAKIPNLRSAAMFDESISHYEIHAHQPYNLTTLATTMKF